MTTDQPEIAHLHVHSEYSLVDGAIRISELISHVAALGHKAVAMTDHGNLFGAVEFYQKAKAKNIKPILGSELYCRPSAGSLAYIEKFDPEFRREKCFNLLQLAENNNGYKNLVRNVSSGYVVGSNVSIPIVTYEQLKSGAKDIIAISSCSGGEIAYLTKKLRSTSESGQLDFSRTDEKGAILIQALTQHIDDLREFFGPNHVFLELTDNGLPEQKTLLPDLAAVAEYFKLPLVASANAHYLKAEDSEAHMVFLAIKNDLKLSQLRNRRQNSRAHVFSNEEMFSLYKRWPEALANTGKIAERCNVTFEFGNYHLPKFDLGTGETAAETLARLAKEGLEVRMVTLGRRYGPDFNEERKAVYYKRLDYEIQMIIKMGFPGYFLIVQDFINWAKAHDIPVGPGRGSGAGSLVAYALKITDIDPIPYNLIFERFLNPERVSMPDFDVDFCQDRRDEVIRYVTERYGADRVAQITTFGKMLAKGAVRDVGRVLDISYTRMDRIAKLIPNELGIKLKDAIEREPKIREEAQKDPIIGDMLALALKLEGLNRHASVHAAGIVISDEKMDEHVPVYRSESGGLITQFEMKNSEAVGLVKFDFLGLKTLTVVDKVVKMLRKSGRPDFDIGEISIADRKVYDLISTGNSVGVFQLETNGMQQLLPKLRPDKFEDIIAQVALFRPGPLQSGMVDDFVERKHKRQEIKYILPELEPILRDTYGIIVYQEQVQSIAAVLANYSLGEADLLRRAMGKKKPEEMAKQKSRFIAGAREKNIPEQTSEEIFDLMAKFAEYGFNKSHSAAYGLISYQTAYLKTHFPEMFMAAIMTCDLDNTDKIVRYVEECRRLKIKVLPPCINRSQLEFSVAKEKVVDFGLAAIKGIGQNSLEPLIQSRDRSGPFTSLDDLAKRVDLHKVGKKTLELLTQAGAMDFFGHKRSTLFVNIGEIVKYSENYHSAKSSGQTLLFDDNEPEKSDDPNDPSTNEIFHNLSKVAKQYKANEGLIQERKLLGVFLSGHPVDLFKEDVQRFANANFKDVAGYAGKSGLTAVAILVDHFERTTRDGRKMMVIRLEDQHNQVEPAVFENEYPKEMPPLFSPVVVSFRVNKGFENFPPRFKLESIMPLEIFRRNKIKRVKITVPVIRGATGNAATSQKTALADIKEVLEKFPGKANVDFTLTYPDGELLLSANALSVDVADDFLQQIKSINTNPSASVSLSYT